MSDTEKCDCCGGLLPRNPQKAPSAKGCEDGYCPGYLSADHRCGAFDWDRIDDAEELLY